MRVLMVTPYPPIRDGIASYAVQEVARLRQEGHDVEVLSPWPSAAHHHLALATPRGPLALARRVGAYDKVIVQYHPAVFYGEQVTPRDRAVITAGLVTAFRRARHLELRAHEPDYELGGRRGARGALERQLWAAADEVTVHSESERARVIETFRLPAARVAVSPHGASFLRRVELDRDGARRALGLPADAFVFLAIGFIQPHKGFDRAVHAFGHLGRHGCRLEIVGSVRVEDPAVLAYRDDLARLVDATPGATLHEDYVDDQEFDTWLVASDVVVLPYRHIWSSGVIERAALYDRPVIATAVGGLVDQARPGTELVANDDELAAAMRRAAGGHGRDVAGPPPGWHGADDLDTVQRLVAERAALERGGPVRAGAGRVGGAGAGSPRGAASDALRRLPPLGLPRPISGRAGGSLLKRIVRRPTAWQVDPIIHHVNRLHDATIESLEER